jgi:hypothetical protein
VNRQTVMKSAIRRAVRRKWQQDGWG